MGTVFLDLNCPRGWASLSQSQLMSVFRLMSMGYSMPEVKLLALLKFSRCKVLGRKRPVRPGEPFRWLVAQRKRFYEVTTMQFAEVLGFMSWMDEIPDLPVRLDYWRGRRAVDSLFQGVPFNKFIITENLYQGYLDSNNDSFLREIADTLYCRQSLPSRLGGLFSRRCRFRGARNRRAFLISVFYWVASLKKYFSARFPDFFQPLQSGSGNLLGSAQPLGRQLEDSMNAQIRALTKGDITKEEEILNLDTWRALTELNAQAKEYAEFNARIKSN